jgi:hypothetical protein
MFCSASVLKLSPTNVTRQETTFTETALSLSSKRRISFSLYSMTTAVQHTVACEMFARAAQKKAEICNKESGAAGNLIYISPFQNFNSKSKSEVNCRQWLVTSQNLCQTS